MSSTRKNVAAAAATTATTATIAATPVPAPATPARPLFERLTGWFDESVSSDSIDSWKLGGGIQAYQYDDPGITHFFSNNAYDAVTSELRGRRITVYRPTWITDSTAQGVRAAMAHYVLHRDRGDTMSIKSGGAPSIRSNRSSRSVLSNLSMLTEKPVMSYLTSPIQSFSALLSTALSRNESNQSVGDAMSDSYDLGGRRFAGASPSAFAQHSHLHPQQAFQSPTTHGSTSRYDPSGTTTALSRKRSSVSDFAVPVGSDLLQQQREQQQQQQQQQREQQRERDVKRMRRHTSYEALRTPLEEVEEEEAMLTQRPAAGKGKTAANSNRRSTVAASMSQPDLTSDQSASQSAKAKRTRQTKKQQQQQQQDVPVSPAGSNHPTQSEYGDLQQVKEENADENDGYYSDGGLSVVSNVSARSTRSNGGGGSSRRPSLKSLMRVTGNYKMVRSMIFRGDRNTRKSYSEGFSDFVANENGYLVYKNPNYVDPSSRRESVDGNRSAAGRPPPSQSSAATAAAAAATTSTSRNHT